MHLSISARFTFKDRPKEHRGFTSESWAFGRTAFVPLAQMCSMVIEQIFNYYLFLCDAGTLNAELPKLIAWLEDIQFQEEPPPVQEDVR